MEEAKKYRKLIKETKDHLNKMLAYRAGANESTRYFLDAIEDKYTLELEELKRKLSYSLPRKQTVGGINTQDIVRARETPFSNVIKIPASKKVLCLFHTDKEPSMHVYQKSYHCFVCEAHGSVIDLVMKLYNLSFVEAVKFLIK